MTIGETLLLVYVFVIAGFLGVELISKVPSQLHTPLMSGTNAISGITIVGAISAAAVALHTDGMISNICGFAAIVLAAINVVALLVQLRRILNPPIAIVYIGEVVALAVDVHVYGMVRMQLRLQIVN